MTRTIDRYARAYINGYDLSGETRSVGPLEWLQEQYMDRAWTWEVRSGLLGQPTIKTGALNTIFRFDTTAANSPHDWLTAMSGGFANIMIPVGVIAAPSAGNPCWMAVQKVSAHSAEAEGMVSANLTFEPSYLTAAGNTTLNFGMPWGTLMYPKTAATGSVNGTTIDNGAATSAGGWMMVQVFSFDGAGEVTVEIHDSADGVNFLAVTDLASGTLTDADAPTSVVAQTTTSAAVRRYTRAVITVTDANSVTLAVAFARGR